MPLAVAYVRAGRRKDALKIVEDLEGRFRHGYISPSCIAGIHSALGEEMMRAEGKAATEIKAILDAQAPMQTTFMQVLFGFIGTTVTGFIVSLIAGAVLKEKDTASTPSAPTAQQS
jgi:hypothetical protein